MPKGTSFRLSDEARRRLAQRAEHEGVSATLLLERLIVEYPRSALVPQARRELDRLGRRGDPRTSNQNTGS
jgi:predicted transcriptional regulator